MDNNLLLKQKLYQACAQNIERRIKAIQDKLDSIADARNKETKSSVGDKHNTGRAMMQIEEENSNIQLSQVLSVRTIFSSIDPDKQTEKSSLGSLVITNKGSYYLAIGVGKVLIDAKTYYCISLDSPIGRLLKNKSTGDQFTFNGNTFTILEII